MFSFLADLKLYIPLYLLSINLIFNFFIPKDSKASLHHNIKSFDAEHIKNSFPSFLIHPSPSIIPLNIYGIYCFSLSYNLGPCNVKDLLEVIPSLSNWDL